MNDIMTICKNTYTRVLRSRSLYVLLAAVLILVAAVHLYTDLTAGRQKELMYDAGAALLTVVGLFTALVVTFDIARDLRERVVMTLLSKPLGRGHYLLGKFLGIAWLVTVNMVILTAGILWILHWEQGAWRMDFIKLACAMWGAMIMVTALGVMFASFLGELPAVVLTAAVFAAGHATESLYRAGTLPGHFLFSVLPGFWLPDFKLEFGNGLPISWAIIILSVLYTLAYSGVLLSLAGIFFHKRDLA
ncbi:MAG: hypothetical protein HY360_27400 [Verrucomicrobia bacterium]|nr:hypothetical protein [Verrucomicrobiota bacterium]